MTYPHREYPGDDPQDPGIDLSDLDAEYEASETPTSGDYEPVPDGKYQVIVESAETTRSKSGGNPMLKWTLRIVAPHHKGRLLWKYNVMVPEKLKWLKGDLHVCKLDLDRLSDLPRHLGKLLDLTLEITKKTNGDFDAIYFNRLIQGQEQIPTGQPGGDIPF